MSNCGQNPPIGGCEIAPPDGYYCSREFHHSGPCANHLFTVPLEDRAMRACILMPPPGYHCVLQAHHAGPCQHARTEFKAGYTLKTDVSGKMAGFGVGGKVEEKSGGPTSYYRVKIANPNQADAPYIAECGDIIEALKMDFNMGCAFKAIWRSAAAQVLDVVKAGSDAKYDAEKVIFYGGRMLANLTGVKPVDPKLKSVEKRELQQRCSNLRQLLTDAIGKTVQNYNLTPLFAEIELLEKLAKE